jgi:hypothetical protein
MDTRPNIIHYDALTGITEVSEMNDEEYAQHLEDVANAPIIDPSPTQP